jgi:putative redox protein
MAATTEATLRWTGGTIFEAAAADGATIEIDMPIELDGTGNGFHPMELLLHALGGCMAVTLAQILAKQRLKLDAYTVTLRGDRAEQPPTRYTHIVVEHRFRGAGLTQANLERLVQRVEERYCAVAATLPHGLAEHRVIIEGEQASSEQTSSE